MSLTQRDWDIMQLEAQLKIQKLTEEWKRGFLGQRGTQPNEQFIQGTPPPEAPPQGMPMEEMPPEGMPPEVMPPEMSEMPMAEEPTVGSGGGY
jgi:hypothetical protein